MSKKNHAPEIFFWLFLITAPPLFFIFAAIA
jgi:hypothetical protein